jgi:predicted GNAT family acetyltransferase
MEVFISLSGSDVTVSDVHCFGNTRGKKYELHGGHLIVAIDPPYAPARYSVIDFVVPESIRGTGCGKQLVSRLLQDYPHDIGAQCSSEASCAIFYVNGFRRPEHQSDTLHDVIAVMLEDSSVYLKRD